MRLSMLRASALLAAALSVGARAESAPPAPTITASVELADSPTTSCPANVNFTGTITATNWPAGSSREVQYHWLHSDGSTESAKPIVFSATSPSTQTITTTWKVATSTNGYATLVIDAPEAQQSNEAHFVLTCTGSTATLGDGSGSGSGGGQTNGHHGDPTPDPQASRPGVAPQPSPTTTPFPLHAWPGSFTVSPLVTVDQPLPPIPCPVIVSFIGSVTAADWPQPAPRTITYHWIRSDGVRGDEKSATLPASGKLYVTTTWKIGATLRNASETLSVDAPKAATSQAARFSLFCPTSGKATLQVP